MLTVKLLFLLVIANGAPIVLHKLLGDRYAWPVDGGRMLADGRPVFGASKTWRGLAAALLLTGPAALLAGWSLALGVGFGGCAMLGDLVSSFIKRRLGMPSSAMALGLDQIPESLLPLVAVSATLNLDAAAIAGLVLEFLVLELALSRLLYALRIRNRPY